MINLNNKKKFTHTLKFVKKNPENMESFTKKFSFDGLFEDGKYIGGGNAYKHLRDYFKSIDFNINIDMNSAYKLLDKKDYQSFTNVIFSSHEFIYHTPCNFKSKAPTKIHHNFIVDLKKYGKYVNEALALIEAESFARHLQGLPENMLNPAKFVELVQKEFQDIKNVKVEVLNKSDLVKKEMNLILGVGQASNESNEPKLLTISINANSSAPKLALVGKGICFDTGGLSLKPSGYLEGMQYDMSGAAIVVGTMKALVKTNSKANVTILAPLAINDIGQNGMKVSDVITSYSKKTVEITNTDAEGRLILADAIAYASKDLKANTIVSIATLTGAIEICLSDTYTGYWLTNQAQNKALSLCAESAGELIWQLPMHEEYYERMKSSKIADLVNSEKTRGAGSSTAACFLSMFANKANFIHMDIASTSEFESSPLPIMLRTLFYFSKYFAK